MVRRDDRPDNVIRTEALQGPLHLRTRTSHSNSKRGRPHLGGGHTGPNMRGERGLPGVLPAENGGETSAVRYSRRAASVGNSIGFIPAYW